MWKDLSPVAGFLVYFAQFFLWYNFFMLIRGLIVDFKIIIQACQSLASWHLGKYNFHVCHICQLAGHYANCMHLIVWLFDLCNLNSLFQNGDQLFKYKFRTYHFVLLIENHLTVVELLDNRTGEVFIGACLVYMTETVSTQAWIGIN